MKQMHRQFIQRKGKLYPALQHTGMVLISINRLKAGNELMSNTAGTTPHLIHNLASPSRPWTIFLIIWRTVLFLCLSSETSLNIFFSHRTSTPSAFEVITETRCINYLLTYFYTSGKLYCLVPKKHVSEQLADREHYLVQQESTSQLQVWIANNYATKPSNLKADLYINMTTMHIALNWHGFRSGQNRRLITSSPTT